jgi:hypothetical protein
VPQVHLGVFAAIIWLERRYMRHPSQSKKFIFFTRFQHLAETHLIGSDIGHWSL